MLIQKTIISHRVFLKVFTVLAAIMLMLGVAAACGGDSDTATEETVPVAPTSEPDLPNSPDESASSEGEEQVVQRETSDPAEPADSSGQSDQPEEAEQPDETEQPEDNASGPAPSSTPADPFGTGIGDLNQVVEELLNEESERAPADIVVAVQDGEIVRGESRYEVDLGENIIIEVSSSQFDREVHVHGYDLTAFAGPITPARFEFVADLAGTWEVEFEDTHELIFELVVS